MRSRIAKRLPPDADKLVGLSLALFASGSRTEDRFWEAKLDALLARIVRNGNQTTLDAALDGFARSPLSYAPPLPRSSVAVDAEDPGALPLRAAAESGLPVTLSLTRPGAFLSRRGPITRLHFGHNYINVLEEDVHLHLRGRQVSGWQTTTEGGQSRWQAIDTNGEPYGLVVEGAAEAFAALQSA